MKVLYKASLSCFLYSAPFRFHYKVPLQGSIKMLLENDSFMTLFYKTRLNNFSNGSFKQILYTNVLWNSFIRTPLTCFFLLYILSIYTAHLPISVFEARLWGSFIRLLYSFRRLLRLLYNAPWTRLIRFLHKAFCTIFIYKIPVWSVYGVPL